MTNCLRLQFRKSPRSDEFLAPKKRAKFSNFGFNRFFRELNLSESWIIEKWLEDLVWRKWKSKTSKISYFHELDLSECFGAKKDIRKISSDHPRGKLYLLKNFFWNVKFSRNVSHNIIYHFLKFQKNHMSKTILKNFKSSKNAHFGPVCGLRHFFRKSGFATLNGLYWPNLMKKIRKL